MCSTVGFLASPRKTTFRLENDGLVAHQHLYYYYYYYIIRIIYSYLLLDLVFATHTQRFILKFTCEHQLGRICSYRYS